MIVIEERIIEVIGLPIVGEHYPNTHDVRLARAQFTIPSNPQMDITKQGYKTMSLLPPYNELAMQIIRYFTCEVRFSYLHAHHLKFLSSVRHNLVVNIPKFLYNMLCITVKET